VRRDLPIKDYGVIGDLRIAALVGINGSSVDIMCFPRFDSPSIFLATVDAERGGRFQITPDLPDCCGTAMHIPDNNVLLTRFLSKTGIAEFELRPDEHATFVMESAEAGAKSRACAEDYYSTSFKRTCNFWRRWIGRCLYNDWWRAMVHRSALTLKLLTSRKFGSIVAAPCFGFPNEIGGDETIGTLGSETHSMTSSGSRPCAQACCKTRPAGAGGPLALTVRCEKRGFG
jgi:GH15 family glucan-1,4-alpha-glucosidase